MLIMCLGENPALKDYINMMNMKNIASIKINNYIKYIKNKLDKRPKMKQWLWFISLWLLGLISIFTLTYPLKLLIKLANG